MRVLTVILGVLLTTQVFAQKERAHVRSGNQRYIEGKWEEAEKEYQKALDIKNNLPEAIFNLGDVAYQKKDFQKAKEYFETAAALAKDNLTKAKAYHNLGNTFLEAQEYEKSIEAFKNALRLNPSDMDSKYNLAYAQHMLKNNPQQNKQNQDQQQKQDQQDQQQNQQNHQQNQQEQQQNQQQDQQAQNQQNQNQQNQQNQKQEANEQQLEQREQEAQSGNLTREEAQRLLEALMREEQRLQQRIAKEKLPAEKQKTDKDW
ncbi:MAG: hypothetical protein KatS3mg031_1288 [Chitinophagales bacterium]|nr:MAG: hypothetical protein KatS3mg031_1288 [Chitinophagales bacterium]